MQALEAARNVQEHRTQYWVRKLALIGNQSNYFSSSVKGDVLGRWAKQGSDKYVGVSRMLIQRLQLLSAHTLRGRPDAAALIGEAESLSELQEVLREREVFHRTKSNSRLGAPTVSPHESLRSL